MANKYSQYLYDDLLKLKAPGLVAASTDSAIVDVGAGFMRGDAVIDVSAVEIASGDERYTVSIEGSNDPTMASNSVCLAKKVFGNLVVPMDAALSAPGRYVIPFRNEENGTVYRYVRVSTLVAGTIATGINFGAFIGKVV